MSVCVHQSISQKRDSYSTRRGLRSVVRSGPYFFNGLTDFFFTACGGLSP